MSTAAGASRFEETKVKQPKKDVGPHVYLYSDRCIMCTRCVRFTREVSGTAELCVSGRGNREEIDVFPGQPLANELSANVVDLCPVGALLDKDFLFAQRVWFLKSTPSIDGITASGDNILIEHNEGKVYRLKPRTNMAVNKWWITDEVRYGWKFIHREDRLTTPMRKQFGTAVPTDFERGAREAIAGLKKAVEGGKARGTHGEPDAHLRGGVRARAGGAGDRPARGAGRRPNPHQRQRQDLPARERPTGSRCTPRSARTRAACAACWKRLFPVPVAQASRLCSLMTSSSRN